MQRFYFGSIVLAVSGFTLAQAVPAQAQLINTNFATQATLEVAPTTIETTARGASSSMSGSGLTGVTLPTIDATGTVTAGAATAPDDLTYNFAQSVNAADPVAPVAIPADGLVTTTPDYSSYTIQAGGVAGTLAGDATSAGVATITAGGVGTTATLLQQRSLSVFR
ncbi:hypothetical protein [Phormidium sp. FACHB-1136]|uniref:hypothetical protein n=1 Tax=Phormidium sp. FACHB-1136 TaxID=2692848 RepID=UPI001684E1F2|nr:hypothetical protein [Phormidium sp. FACHB-1136]MBD2429140.1 hypothetical protein [Phormidium sp. FACHB-1136]